MNETYQKALGYFHEEYNGQPHFMTPEIWDYGIIRGRLAYELSYGSGMFDNRYMFGITVLFIGDDDDVTRGHDANRCLSGNSLSDLAQDAKAYLNELAKERGI